MSRLRRAKDRGTNFGDLLRALAVSLDEAASRVEHEREDEVRRIRAAADSARQQLRERGLLFRAPDGREQMVVSGRVVLPPPEEPIEVDSDATRYAAATRIAAAGLRAAGVRILEPTTPRFRFGARLTNENQKARRGERANFEKCAQNLIRWLAAQGLTQGMSDEWMAKAHLDPKSAHYIASMHVDCANVRTKGLPACSRTDLCSARAVCRALLVVTLGLDTPLRAAIRQLANASFDVAGDLDAMIIWATDENPEFKCTVFDDLAGLSLLLRGLDPEARLHSLTSYGDRAPRGERPRQAILIDATRYLAQGGFGDAQIAEFLDDGFPNPSRRPKRVADLLNAKPPPNTWLGFAQAATPEQVERARREPDLEWLEGQPYRRTASGSFEPA
jgi:hypothetical protein